MSSFLVWLKLLLVLILPAVSRATPTVCGSCTDCAGATEVKIPLNLGCVQANSFENCLSITSVVIPVTVTCIANSAFRGATNLVSVVVEGSALNSIADHAFRSCTSLASINIPSPLTSIGSFAFYETFALSQIDLSAASSLSSIGSNAFQYSGIRYLILTNGINNIGSYAFSYCPFLENAWLPHSVSTIGAYSFAFCRSLMSVKFGAGLTGISNNAFEGCSRLTGLALPSTMTGYVGANAFKDCVSLSCRDTSLAPSIDGSAFSGVPANLCAPCTDCAGCLGLGIQAAIIPASEASVAAGAFQSCTTILSVVLPPYVTTINPNAFDGASNLNCIALLGDPNFITIGLDAFRATPTNFCENPSYQDRAICDFIRATNINDLIGDATLWQCNAMWPGPLSDPCDVTNPWPGLTCSGSTITKLQVSGLSGTLPDTLAYLTALDTLFVGAGYLSGTVPAYLGSLTSLSSLRIYNSLTGTIPSTLGLLTNLNLLSLHGNKLVGSIPTSLAKLTKIGVLSLSGNSLSGSIPASLCTVTSLTSLYATSPDLKCYAGCLTSKPDHAFGLAQKGCTPPRRDIALCDFVAATNIASIGGYDEWTCVVGFTQTDPCATAATWTGIICIDSKIVSLVLDSISLTGTLPSSIGYLTDLSFLKIENNAELAGTLPDSLGSLIGLDALTVAVSKVTGTIPTTLGSILGLRDLYIHGNKLSGSVPESLCATGFTAFLVMNNPTALKCYASCLTSVPNANFGTLNAGCPNFQEDALCGLIAATDISTLTPTYSQWVCDSIGFTTTPPCAAGAKWTGVIVCDGDFITHLGISSMNIVGTIPEVLGRLSTLTRLRMLGNHLGGSVPPSLGSLSDLDRLELETNSLIGSLPATLAGLTKLGRLSIDSNKLTGMTSIFNRCESI
jgi:Leucine-rich repeat (LRR) protein